MKIYSWNIFYRNPQLESAYQFIKNLDFDILCLQEVPEDFLERLKKLSCHIAFAPEVDRLFSHGIEQNFLVILSRHPVIRTEKFSLPMPHIPRRTRLLVKAMRPLHWSSVRNRHGFYADIAPNGLSSIIRVFCLHLFLAHPEVRRNEFDIAMKHLDTKFPAIVCGDLNVLDSPFASSFNWLLGGRPSDAFAWRRERREIERQFAKHRLLNPLSGKATYLFPRCQLDHILVSRQLPVERAVVIPERVGSDHNPIQVTIGF